MKKITTFLKEELTEEEYAQASAEDFADKDGKPFISYCREFNRTARGVDCDLEAAWNARTLMNGLMAVNNAAEGRADFCNKLLEMIEQHRKEVSAELQEVQEYTLSVVPDKTLNGYIYRVVLFTKTAEGDRKPLIDCAQFRDKQDAVDYVNSKAESGKPLSGTAVGVEEPETLSSYKGTAE